VNITCILPVYNGENYLAQALQTVLDQRHSDLEILVVNDGSTDGTSEVLAGFEGHIRVLEQEHSGVAGARNLALREAKGAYLAFQDADDLWMPGKLRLQEERFRARPELEMSLGLIQNFWMEELAEEAAAYENQRFSQPIPGYSLVCMLARRSLFERVGGFDPSLRVGSDNDWFLRARDAEAVEEVIPELLVRRRLHAHNLTRADLAGRDTLLRNVKASLDRRRQSGSH
jgi:glycosyltransferase involved in cell wall biosynthesis